MTSRISFVLAVTASAAVNAETWLGPWSGELMGPTDPVVTQSDYARTIILRKAVPCGPCYRRTCPTDHRCMKLITPDMVLAPAEELLSKTRK